MSSSLAPVDRHFTPPSENTHIIPNRHDQHHWLARGITHLLQSTHLLELLVVTESILGRVAEARGDALSAIDVFGAGDFDLLSVLDEILRDGVESAARAMKLGDHGELLAGVYRLPLAVEVGVAVAERVEITAVGVALRWALVMEGDKERRRRDGYG